MLRSLYTAGTGMVAQQHNLDVIANNLANVNTTGFKQQRAEFEDLMYQTMRSAGVAEGSSAAAPENMQIGLGVKLAGTSSNFQIGSFQNTGNSLNLAISGNGFFKLTQPDGTAVYTRDGSFQPDAEGKLVNMDGLKLDPEVTIPQGSTSITVNAQGDVSAVAPGETSSKVFGKVQVSSVANPAGMTRLGSNLFAATEASGDVQSGTPGENGTGMLQSGYLEGSNVEVVEEMTRMITAQRAYEINSKAIQTADDMLGIVNNLKR
jgi:flagellar basal-body rod protein FlgG